MRSLLVSVMCVLAVSAESAEETAWQASLIVPPGAVAVHRSRLEGSEQVYFELRQTYPAADLIDGLEAELSAQGWTPMVTSLLNPDTSTASLRQWGQFFDGTGDVLEVVHQWWGDWSHPDGSAVTYILRYTYPEEADPDLEKLTVSEIYRTPPSVSRLMAELPYHAENLEAVHREWELREQERVEEIRARSTSTGRLTFRVLAERSDPESAPAASNSSGGEVEFDPAVPGLIVDVAAATVEPGARAVELVFTRESADRLRAFSQSHRRRQVAMVVDGEVLASPVLHGPIGDSARIETRLPVEELEQIVDRIMGR